MRKNAPDAVDKANRRLREDNKQSKRESGYRRNAKKTKRNSSRMWLEYTLQHSAVRFAELNQGALADEAKRLHEHSRDRTQEEARDE